MIIDLFCPKTFNKIGQAEIIDKDCIFYWFFKNRRVSYFTDNLNFIKRKYHIVREELNF